ncbi:hypothetical protein Ami103574_04450 [Aminipila butyrica]|uniref:Uncharacterized protein n=1 Tax=Aminipila butyrica TaxID=433296 RepID=A0A858BRT2_9FIRM|nr:hypothetical protein [Aminipila butyrica]QIB68613.1 hypothetical protein Ami103574_04450 [Aminipila butyrica]
MDERERLQQEFVEKIQEIIDGLEKQKLPLRAKLLLWMLKRKVKRVK